MQGNDAVERALSAIHRGTAADRLESETLEFKTEQGAVKDTCSDLADAVVCLANSSGGDIVLGVRDHPGGPEAFIGTRLAVDLARQRLYALTEPPLLVGVTEITRYGVRLLLIRVNEGVDVHSTTRGLTTRRLESSCQPMRPVDVSRLTDERRGLDWSAQSSGRRVKDIEPQAMRRVRRLLAATADDTKGRLAEADDIDVLQALHLLATDGTLTRAGEILLCEQASSAGAEVLVYQHRRTMSGEADAVRRWGTPMLLAFEEGLEAVEARQGITPVNLPGGQQLRIEDYPQAAVREALANALLHGDYRDRRPVQIEHSSELLRIVSPGPLVAGVTRHNILSRGSRARFPILAQSFRNLGLAEELGQGVDRMFREMVRSGRDVPDIRDDSDEVAVALTGGVPNTRIAKFLRELPAAEGEDTEALLILHMLCQRRSVTADLVAPVVQQEPARAERTLRRLATDEASVLEHVRGTIGRSHPSYRLRSAVLAKLGPAVTYHRRSASEVDRKVVEHVRDYGEINNRALQRMLDVDVYQARDLLQDLVGREILTRISEQRRGTAVRYGPGPLFPGRRRRSR